MYLIDALKVFDRTQKQEQGETSPWPLGGRVSQHGPLGVDGKGESTWPPRSWEGARAEVGV